MASTGGMRTETTSVRSTQVRPEGIWTGLQGFLRRFRGVSKTYLAQYVAVFEFLYNDSDQSWALPRAIVLPDFTFSPT